MSVSSRARLFNSQSRQIQKFSRPPGGDILRGAGQIAEFLFGNPLERRTVYYLVEIKCMPVFRLGSGICARKSTLLKWLTEQEGRSLAATDAFPNGEAL